MKKVLISTKPKWCEDIASDKKKIEVRKSRPKIEIPFKCLIYCTKDKYEHLYDLRPYTNGTLSLSVTKHNSTSLVAGDYWNGKVIGEFVCDRIDRYLCEEYEWEDGQNSLEYRIRSVEGRKTCLDYDELREYGNEKPLYFWHISDLKIYDNPKELSEFYTRCNIPESKCKLCDNCFDREDSYGRQYAVKQLTRPPQSWCYVE